MSTLIWLHEDALRADHPLFNERADAPACFIWDDAYMTAMHYGLKRRVFIYETLLELPVDIYAGDTQTSLRALLDTHKADCLVTGKTPNPRLKDICTALRGDVAVRTIADTPFVQMDAPQELRRFFKYWNKARKKAFLPDGRA